MNKLLVKILIDAVGEDHFSPLNDPLVRFAHVTLAMCFAQLKTTFGEKIEEICTAEHIKMQEVVGISRPSIQPLQTKLEKSRRFLNDIN